MRRSALVTPRAATAGSCAWLTTAGGSPVSRGEIILAANNNRDLVMTAADFERICELIHKRAGIALAPHKSEMAYSRLAKRLRLLGKQRFRDYLGVLEADANGPEWEHFTNALTTNLTAFFREAHHFPLLADYARRQREPVNVWSCAASTGEEVYSIAITLAEALGQRAQSARVLGTDIDTRALVTAKAGIYPCKAVEELSAQRLKRFFLQGTGKHGGMVRVQPALCARVEFHALNLIAPRWPQAAGPFDIIFCRNLMIYFDRDTRRRVLERFAGVLKPGGLLFAGHSENVSDISSAFKLTAKTVYEVAAPLRQVV